MNNEKYKKKVKKSFFLQILASLLFFMFSISLIVGVVAYTNINNVLKEEKYKTNKELLQQTMKIVEIVLKEVEKRAISLALNKDIQRIESFPWSITEDYEVINSIHELLLNSLTNRLALKASAFARLCHYWKGNKLNIIFILIDDMGCYGSKFYETPNIDKLASKGMRFTDAYTAFPVCSSTRTSITGGKYPTDIGLIDWIEHRKIVNRGEVNLLIHHISTIFR